MNWAFVFLGGGLGSVLRFYLSFKFNSHLKQFPFGTLSANVISCFILGVLYFLYIKNDISESTRLLMMIGFCGGFSTFSTYGLEMVNMFQKGEMMNAFIYMASSNVLCLIALILGYFLTNRISLV